MMRTRTRPSHPPATRWKALARLLTAVALAAGLAACGSDSGSDSGGSSATVSSDSSQSASKEACYAELQGFDAGPVCTADKSAQGADTLCYQIDGGSTVTAVESDDEVYGYQHTTESGEVRTRVGLTMGSGANDDSDGVALYVEATGGQTGTVNLGRFSSWSEDDYENYRAIGSDSGCGRAKVNTHGDVGGTLAGEFEAYLCAYNGNTHVVECESGKVHLKGAFDITRGSNVDGGSGTPF